MAAHIRHDSISGGDKKCRVQMNGEFDFIKDPQKIPTNLKNWGSHTCEYLLV